MAYTPTVTLFVPKFGREVRVNPEDEARFRSEFGAYAPGETPATPAPSTDEEATEGHEEEAVLKDAAPAAKPTKRTKPTE